MTAEKSASQELFQLRHRVINFKMLIFHIDNDFSQVALHEINITGIKAQMIIFCMEKDSFLFFLFRIFFCCKLQDLCEFFLIQRLQQIMEGK